MGCLSGIAKYLLFLFNFLIVVCGIVLIAIGAIILVNENKGIESFTDFSVGGFAIAVGVIIFLIAFFGCCGAIKENSCLLTSYAVILIVLLILQIVLGALAFVAIKNDDGELDKQVNTVVNKVFEDYVKDNTNEDKKKVIDEIQKDFECCGVNGPRDWDTAGLDVPDSCYEDGDRQISKRFTVGCANKFKDVITSSIKVIGGVAIGFAVVEVSTFV
jgi:CD63 antigen